MEKMRQILLKFNPDFKFDPKQHAWLIKAINHFEEQAYEKGYKDATSEAIKEIHEHYQPGK